MSSELPQNIVIGTVNRSQLDHRVFEKWGLYFSSHGIKNINIFGKKTKEKIDENFKFHNSLKHGRVLSPLLFLLLILKTKPDIIICTTFELLIPCGLFKFIYRKRTKVYYDVMENYTLNIKHQNNYPNLLKSLLIPHVKFREWLSKFFVTHYFYSDNIYLKQLPFLSQNSSYLPNYYSFPEKIITPTRIKPLTFLITGTISKDYGVEKGIEWFLRLKARFPNSILKIIGHETSNFNKTESDSIHYESSPNHVPHKKILTEISNSDVLLLPYEWTESFYGCIPSKVYEAISLGTNCVISYSDHLKHFKKLQNVHMIKNTSNLNQIELEEVPLKNTDYLFINLYPKLDSVFNF